MGRPRTIIVPSASGVVLLVAYAMTSLLHSCDPEADDRSNPHYESASAQNGGMIKDYVPPVGASEAAGKPGVE